MSRRALALLATLTLVSWAAGTNTWAAGTNSWARTIDDLPARLADASSKMPDHCRVEIAGDLAGLLAVLEAIEGGRPFAPVTRDSMHAAIAPLSRFYPEGEKLLYFSVAVAIDRYDGVCRVLDPALADSLATDRTRVRLASSAPTDNSHVNKYLAMLAARLGHLHGLLNAMLDRIHGHQAGDRTPLPELDTVDSIDVACDAIAVHMSEMCRAAERLVATWPR